MTNCQSLHTLLYVSIMFVAFSTFFNAFVLISLYWADFHAPVAAGKHDIAGSRETHIISWKTLQCKRELENESFPYSSFTLHTITWPLVKQTFDDCSLNSEGMQRKDMIRGHWAVRMLSVEIRILTCPVHSRAFMLYSCFDETSDNVTGLEHNIGSQVGFRAHIGCWIICFRCHRDQRNQRRLWAQ